MSDMRIGSFNFERGIEGISHYGRDAAGAGLPERQDLAPTGEGVKAQLAQLLDKPGVDRYLDEVLKPAVSNRDLLMPGKFSQSLHDALAALSEAAAADSENARVLNRAVRLLKDEVGLRDMVAMYRSALYQG